MAYCEEHSKMMKVQTFWTVVSLLVLLFTGTTAFLSSNTASKESVVNLEKILSITEQQRLIERSETREDIQTINQKLDAILSRLPNPE